MRDNGGIYLAKKKNLGRGLDDLLNQHDTDLPFLSSYGEDEKLSLDQGLAPSVSSTNFQELMEALRRLVLEEGAPLSKKSDNEYYIEGFLVLKLMKEGILLTVKSDDKEVPLVPTDLQQPGMKKGKISSDCNNCEVIIVDWGVPCRRLIERMVEFWKINFS